MENVGPIILSLSSYKQVYLSLSRETLIQICQLQLRMLVYNSYQFNTSQSLFYLMYFIYIAYYIIFVRQLYIEFTCLKLLNTKQINKMPDNFTKLQIQALRKQFEKYDQNGDNSMTTKELGEVMRSLGQNPTQYQIQMLIKQVDGDDSGTIDFGQFLSLMGRKMKNIQSQEQLREVFDYFDADGDGIITPNDLKMALTKQFGTMKNQRINQLIDHMINQVDIDEDGKINFLEFVTIMMAI